MTTVLVSGEVGNRLASETHTPEAPQSGHVAARTTWRTATVRCCARPLTLRQGVRQDRKRNQSLAADAARPNLTSVTSVRKLPAGPTQARRPRFFLWAELIQGNAQGSFRERRTRRGSLISRGCTEFLFCYGGETYMKTLHRIFFLVIVGLLICGLQAKGQTLPQFGHVVIVALENNGYSSVVGSSSMPYLNSLIAKYGLATNYNAQHN